MNLILPIVIVALVLGLSRDKMTPARWFFMIAVILATLLRYGMKH
ncbi:MAG: hypothetical protein P4L33_13775 [Capsulimonadaceae bacterium]|nr:hypothetical protein [Capsulimonadaceae bacterium]